MASFSLTTVVIAGLVIGAVLGLTGAGGSILTVPVLVYAIGLDTKTAIATSLLIVGLASLGGLLGHARNRNVRWRIGLVFGAAGMVGAYSGGRIAEYVPDLLLLLTFAVIMIGCGVAMMRKRSTGRAASASASSHRYEGGRVLIDGFIVGVVTGLVGAGGGFLVVPALALLGGLPMHAAIGTSLLVIAMKCFAALAGYIEHAPIDASAAALIGGFAVFGTVLGTNLSKRINADLLRLGFGAFVLLIAGAMITLEVSTLVESHWITPDLWARPVVIGACGFITYSVLALLVRRVVMVTPMPTPR